MVESHLTTPAPGTSKVDTNDPKVRCFVAYPSSAQDRAETIETAIDDLNNGGVVEVFGWKQLKIGGRLVIGTICDEIKRCEVFIADVTGLNPNVLFELGYAIAQKKRVWLLLNSHIERAKTEFERFELLTTVGYASYSNSHEIVTPFYRQEPYKNLGKILYDDLLASAGPPSKKDALLYLRCDVNTEASLRLARRVSTGPIRSVIDDPQEVRLQSLPWYVQQVTAAYAVVCHLLSTEYAHWELHNAKHALVSGFALGMGKPLLMLAHEPYASPLDYHDLLRKHATAATAESIFADWSLPLIQQYETRIARVAEYRAEEQARRELRDITIGEPVAEFESDSVPGYYVTTATYSETLHAKYSIVVGRKGTGKTAALYALTDHLLSDPRNHVCTIKPVGYELEGLLGILRKELSRAEKGYLVESFWKFLLYTELAKSTYDQLLGKANYYVRTPAELALCEFVDQYRSLITPEFSIRLEATVGQLHGLSEVPSEDSGGQRVKISELLHNEMLAKLRVLLGDVLQNKARVAVMVDNLDKAWNPNGDLSLLSDLLFGLLSVSRRVSEEFGRNASGLARVNLFFALFLRSDIYAAMLEFAKERDKLPARLITWNDSELLKRIIEERFVKSGADVASPSDVWERYFASTVGGIPSWEYITLRILPRPRDLIFLVKSALQFAVNRGHTKVEEKDIRGGEVEYSRFALNSLIVEAIVKIPKVQNLLMYFVQSSELVTEHDVDSRTLRAGMQETDKQMVIDWLVRLTFLGFETAPSRFEFLHDEQDLRKLEAMARKTADETTGGVRRFCIHPAFHAFLEISSNRATTPGQMVISL